MDSPGAAFSANDANILKELMGMGLKQVHAFGHERIQNEKNEFPQATNTSYGPQVQGFATGGQVDSVPAMLTPGEFVMKPSAVSKYGTGFMHKLNQGKVSGFSRGGVVYLAGGGFGAIGGGADPGHHDSQREQSLIFCQKTRRRK
jgi:hypothetical protein